MSLTPVTRLMVVTASSLDLAALQSYLRESPEEGFVVHHAATVGEAVARLAEGPFDVVLSDLGMPDALPLEVPGRLSEAAPEVPLIVLAGLKERQIARRALDRGAHDFLEKERLTADLLVRALRYARSQSAALVELAETRERYDLAMRGANDGIWDWDLERGRINFSPRWKAILGHSEEEISDNPEEWFGRIHPEHLDAVLEAIRAHHRQATPFFESEHLLRHRDGSYRWVLCRGTSIRDKMGDACRMAGSITDVTRRKSTEVQLHHESLHDRLTDLPNRTLFLNQLMLSIAQGKRLRKYSFAVLLLDIDRFKVVNDNLGHGNGDQLLVGVARRIESVLRHSDTLARMGGDEFGILLHNIMDLRDAARVANQIHRVLERPFHVGGTEVICTVSIGIAHSLKNYDNPDDVLRDAETALYRAKANGRARHEVFEVDMQGHTIGILRMETDLRRAVDQRQFLIHYQPIVDLETRRLEGLEALVRWLHPERGLIYPDEFIPLAEETGLIISIGNWVLREACQQIVEWKKRYPAYAEISISVNLSALQLAQSTLPRIVANVLEETGLAPGDLHLELTESMIMDPGSGILETLRSLKAIGVHLQIDDFGTGYSSLSYLHQFPIDHLKIDKSFISRIDTGDGKNLEIVRTITNLARNLSMQVIAEGVETDEQLERLRTLRITRGQGFFFSRPLDCDGAGDYFDRSARESRGGIA